MRLVTIRPMVGDWATGAHHRPAIALPSGRLLPIGAFVDAAPTGLPAEFGRMELAELLAADPGLAAIREAFAAADSDAMEAASLAPGNVRLLAPIPRPGKIVGVGYNYLDHIREQGLERPARPVLFSMFANAVASDADPIRHPAGTHALDLEAELAVVIGKRCKNVAKDRALDYVLGYTCANDVSARDWQGKWGGSQWCRGKTFDTFAPIGPCLVTADEIENPNSLGIRTVLNGHTMQDSNTADMIFDVRTLIEFLSGSTTLLPGTVILTGTPSGIGAARKPPVFLKAGDTVSIEIDRIGSLTNPILDEGS